MTAASDRLRALLQAAYERGHEDGWNEGYEKGFEDGGKGESTFTYTGASTALTNFTVSVNTGGTV